MPKPRLDEMKSVKRFDVGVITGKAEKTDEGYIRADAVVTRIGVFDYQNADGSLRRELRHPDDVFELDSLSSMKMIPVTLNHPSKMVTADSAKDLQVGFTGENVRPQGNNVMVTLTVTDSEAVKAIEQGKKELSLGYNVDLLPTKGNYDGEDYSYRQSNIRYNHLAVVDQARAGAEARINLDRFDGVQLDKKEKQPPQRKGQEMPKIKTDSGLEYEVSAEVAVAYDGLSAKVDSVSKDLTESKTNLDKMTAERDDLKAKLDKAEAAANDTSKFDAAVKGRIALVESAKPYLSKETAEKLDTMSDNEIRQAVVVSVDPKANLDGKSDEYILARFDAALSVDPEAGAADQRADVNGDEEHTDSKDEPKSYATSVDRADAGKAREKMLSEMQTAWDK